jgi:hypothetical protein
LICGGNLKAPTKQKGVGHVVDLKEGLLELLTDKNSILALVDYQPSMFKGVASSDKTIIKNAAFCAAKAASILGIPIVLSTINPKSNGDFISEITALFPGQEVFARKVPCFKTKETGMLSRPPVGENWLYPASGPACVLLIALFMLSKEGLRFTV